MRYTIDRITDGIASLEPEDHQSDWLEISDSQLPKGACEGMVLMITSRGFQVDPDTNQQQQQRINNKLNQLRNCDNS